MQHPQQSSGMSPASPRRQGSLGQAGAQRQGHLYPGGAMPLKRHFPLMFHSSFFQMGNVSEENHAGLPKPPT